MEELCERHLMVLVRLQDRIQGPGSGLCGACKTLHQRCGQEASRLIGWWDPYGRIVTALRRKGQASVCEERFSVKRLS